MRHLDGTSSRFVSHLASLAIRSGNRRAARQRQAQCFGDGVHRGRGAHAVAVTGRGRRGRGRIEKLLLGDLSRAQAATAAPDHRAGADQLVLEITIEHRAAGEHDRGNVHRRSGHDRGRRRLVTAGREHDRVDGIAVQNLDQAEISEIAIERRGRATAVLENRMRREFHRNAAGVANAFFDARRRDRHGCDCKA